MPAHPLLFGPDHPLVRRVRALCLRYPEAAEVIAHGRFTYRAQAAVRHRRRGGR